MRYNFSPSLWILIYLFFVWNYKRFNCNDICNNPDLGHHEIVIIENDTYRYSLRYHYSMRIQRYQSQPVPSERFNNKVDDGYEARPQFSFSHYGSHVEEIDDQELLGVRKNFSIYVNDSDVTITMTTLIHPNGKVSFYYDNIPTDFEESRLQSKISGFIRCDNVVTQGYKYPGIRVPAKWIKSGSLVEFEVIGEICSQYNTSETCQNATTSNTTCIWCEKGEKCIESNDQNTHGLKVNDCRVEKKSDVNDFSTSTPIKDIETTLRSTEVQVTENLIETTEERYKHLTTKKTEENKQHKSHWYLYVVIPLVASLFLICIGCIIWRWLLRRKRSNE
ncbi:unnamed protein product [Schistosoma rodhaini]|nr:unnamed protein product [Schistosoma rodhaini]